MCEIRYCPFAHSKIATTAENDSYMNGKYIFVHTMQPLLPLLSSTAVTLLTKQKTAAKPPNHQTASIQPQCLQNQPPSKPPQKPPKHVTTPAPTNALTTSRRLFMLGDRTRRMQFICRPTHKCHPPPPPPIYYIYWEYVQYTVLHIFTYLYRV